MQWLSKYPFPVYDIPGNSWQDGRVGHIKKVTALTEHTFWGGEKYNEEMKNQTICIFTDYEKFYEVNRKENKIEKIKSSK